jgi:hypothetical protein
LELSETQFDTITQAQSTQVKPTSWDAATVHVYPGLKGDAWWDMNQLCDQVTKKALPIFEALHPGCQAVFLFDCFCLPMGHIHLWPFKPRT